MQASGGGGHGPLLHRENSLVISPVLLVSAALARNVGRQWNLTDHGNGLIQCGALQIKGERQLPTLAFLLNSCIQATGKKHFSSRLETHAIAPLELLGGFHEGLPTVAVEAQVQQGLNLGRGTEAINPMARERRWYHARVVEDQHIACAK